MLAAGAVSAAPPGADELFARRDRGDNAARAAAIWRAAPAAEFDAAWKLARADYWIGTHPPASGQRAALEEAVSAGARAVAIDGARPEGYFWRAAGMGALAESFGLMQGLKYRGRIRADLERVLAIDPAWQQGSADRALGRWFQKVPGLFGGSDTKAEAHYRASLRYNPRSTATLFFLGDLLWEKGRREDARALFQQVLDAPLDADWAPEDHDFKERARARLNAR